MMSVVVQRYLKDEELSLTLVIGKLYDSTGVTFLWMLYSWESCPLCSKSNTPSQVKL